MACARLPGSIQLVKTLDASLDGVKDWIAFGRYTQCPTLFRSPLATCPGTGECISLSGYLQRPIVQNCPGPWFQFPGTNVLQN